MTFSFLFYCEQREVFYSDLANKDAPSPSVVFYDHVSTVTSCGVKCFNDNCCVRFIYSTISKQCMGVHVMESDVYFYQQAPSWSSEMQQFRKGKNGFESTVLFLSSYSHFSFLFFILSTFESVIWFTTSPKYGFQNSYYHSLKQTT